MKRTFLLFTLIPLLISCNIFKKHAGLKNLNKEANDENIVMVGYQPIDPIQISTDTNSEKIDLLLSSFSNEATRLAIGEVDQKGSISFKPFSYAHAGRSYSIILDYIKYTTSNLEAKYDELTTYKVINDSVIEESKQQITTNFGSISALNNDYYGERTSVPPNQQSINTRIKLPVYVGIGVRLQASITVFKDSVNLSSLFGIGLAASQNRLSGTLIIQTLGITGEDISPLMPLPNEINESTIQSAIQAIATIKSKIYQQKKIVISPQVVAFKLPFSIDGADNLIESTLQSDPPRAVLVNKTFIFPITGLSKSIN